MGCGESKHAVAIENTLTKSKSKSKSINNGSVGEEEKEVLKTTDEGTEKAVVDDHKDGEGKLENAAAAGVVMDEINKENSAEKEADESVISNGISQAKLEGNCPKEKGGDNDTNKEKVIFSSNDCKEVEPAEETKSSAQERTPADQNENGNAEAPTADDKAN